MLGNLHFWLSTAQRRQRWDCGSNMPLEAVVEGLRGGVVLAGAQRRSDNVTACSAFSVSWCMWLLGATS